MTQVLPDGGTRTWTGVGREAMGVALEDGRSKLSRARVEHAIAQMRWIVPEGSHPMVPALGVQQAIRELRIPKVSLISINVHELAPYGIYGIEGHYKNGRVRVYVIDRGSVLIPVASDFWPSSGEERHRHYGGSVSKRSAPSRYARVHSRAYRRSRG